jgi:hypothetical protein
MINCDHCNKSFSKGYLFERHMRRKFPCFTSTNTPPPVNSEIVKGNSENVKVNSEIVKGNSENVKDKVFQCTQCNKSFSTKYTLNLHKCKGCNVLQCHICLKTFSSSSGKSQHTKNVVCRRVIPIDTPNPTSVYIQKANVINNTTTNNFVINWSDEHYGHVTPRQLVEVIEKCVDHPAKFFSEFPRIAHQGEHANLRVTNMRANYGDAYEGGRFIKMSIQSMLDECAKKMIYRLDDASLENDAMFRKYERLTNAIVHMEDVINETVSSGVSVAVKESLRVMHLETLSAKRIIISELKSGLY